MGTSEALRLPTKLFCRRGLAPYANWRPREEEHDTSPVPRRYVVGSGCQRMETSLQIAVNITIRPRDRMSQSIILPVSAYSGPIEGPYTDEGDCPDAHAEKDLHLPYLLRMTFHA